MKKRILSVMLFFSIIICCMALPVTATTEASGTCGDNLTWTLDTDGTLSIRGTEYMESYASAEAVPWHSYRSQIKTVVIYPCVLSVSDYAFGDSTSLETVYISHNVYSVGDMAFSNCNSIKDVYYGFDEMFWEFIEIGEGNECLTNATIHYDSGNEILVNGDCGDNHTWSLDLSGKLEISGTGDMDAYSTTLTSSNAPWFNYKNDILHVEITDGVTSVGASSFYCFDTIKSVKLADSVTKIGNFAFSYCSGLRTLNSGNGLQTIGYGAFTDCGFKTLTNLPDSLTSIGREAFMACSQLKTVVIPDSVVTIERDAFSSCDGLSEITLGNKLQTIGNYAFEICESLKKVNYNGSEYHWDKISIGAGNECLTDATIEYKYNKLWVENIMPTVTAETVKCEFELPPYNAEDVVVYLAVYNADKKIIGMNTLPKKLSETANTPVDISAAPENFGKDCTFAVLVWNDNCEPYIPDVSYTVTSDDFKISKN